MKVKAFTMGNTVASASHRIKTCSESSRGVKSPTALRRNHKTTYPSSISWEVMISACSPCCSLMKCSTIEISRTSRKSWVRRTDRKNSKHFRIKMTPSYIQRNQKLNFDAKLWAQLETQLQRGKHLLHLQWCSTELRLDSNKVRIVKTIQLCMTGPPKTQLSVRKTLITQLYPQRNAVWQRACKTTSIRSWTQLDRSCLKLKMWQLLRKKEWESTPALIW